MLHLLILMLFMKNWKEFIFLPPKKEEKKISLNLQQIVTPPAPKPKPVPVPEPVVIPPTPKPVIQKPLETAVQPIKRKKLDESKKIFAQQSTEENNVTKTVPKPVQKIVQKEEKKKVIKKVQKKTVAKKRKHTDHLNVQVILLLMRSWVLVHLCIQHSGADHHLQAVMVLE
ncbi:hypothetical protein [Sulfurovum sp. AR]|uniref:hypothetical protein n=1 Tax=Sulfurovum sp. AR TaxID=1165841 RepID=UPI00025C4A62|nr:hypothetical protein [Sulfurovum sp. AR]EIF51830.1 hypothetical protein SULAR_03168 [Sulfurovum sp. AR]